MDDRKLEVLRAIVSDYVQTREPVGSKALVERHRLDVSPATIRNDMAVLEDEGYLIQPHTSAGRIPTDKGYRLFVDRLTTIKPLSAAERRAISTFLAGAADVDDIVHIQVPQSGYGQSHARGDAWNDALQLAEAFRARIVDATTDSFIFELTGRPDKIDEKALHHKKI